MQLKNSNYSTNLAANDLGLVFMNQCNFEICIQYSFSFDKNLIKISAPFSYLKNKDYLHIYLSGLN